MTLAKNKTCLATMLLAGSLVGALAGPVDAQGTGPSWISQCVAPDRSTPATCTLSHSVRIQETGQVLFLLEIRTGPTLPIPLLNATIPLGIHIPSGVALAVDGVDMTALPIERCDQQTCYSAVALAPDSIARMSRGAVLELSFSPNADVRQSLDLSLEGFGTQFEAIALPPPTTE